MPSAIPSLNVGGVQPPYDPISSAAGSLQAVNPNELTITAGGTLQFINGPVIPAPSTTPEILQANSIAAPSGYSASIILGANGRPGGNAGIVIDSYGGTPFYETRRTDGTASAPTAVVSGDVIGAFEAAGYNGSSWAISPTFQFYAVENWSTTASGSAMGVSVVESGTNSQVTPFLVSGQGNQGTVFIAHTNASGTISPVGTSALQVTNGTSTDTLNIGNAGTFIANGTTAVTVAATGVTANSVIIPSVHTASSPGAAPHVTSINAGTNFTIVATAGDASTYNYVIIN